MNQSLCGTTRTRAILLLGLSFLSFSSWAFEATDLMNALDSGNLEKLKKILTQNPALANTKFLVKSKTISGQDSSDLTDAPYSTPLSQIILESRFTDIREQAIQLLLNAGADPNVKSYDRWGGGTAQYPIFDIIKKYQSEHSPEVSRTLKQLLKAGVDFNKVDDQGRTAFHAAIQSSASRKDSNGSLSEWPPFGALDMVLALIQSGAPVTSKNKKGETPVESVIAQLNTVDLKYERTKEIYRQIIIALQTASIQQQMSANNKAEKECAEVKALLESVKKELQVCKDQWSASAQGQESSHKNVDRVFKSLPENESSKQPDSQSGPAAPADINR